MSIVMMSDGQTVNSEDISLVRLYGGPDRLMVELTKGDSIKVYGSGVHADANLLDDVRDREKLHYKVQRPKNNLFYAVVKDGNPNIWSLPEEEVSAALEEKGYTLIGSSLTKQEAYEVLLKRFGELSVRHL